MNRKNTGLVYRIVIFVTLYFNIWGNCNQEKTVCRIHLRAFDFQNGSVRE